MAFVLDASLAIAWVVPSQSTAYTRRIRLQARREPYHVPEIFTSEVTNVLVVLERRGILNERGADAAAEVLCRLNPLIHPLNLDVLELRKLAKRFGLTAYDACYLALALELRLPVACGDRPFKTALVAAGVKLV